MCEGVHAPFCRLLRTSRRHPFLHGGVVENSGNVGARRLRGQLQVCACVGWVGWGGWGGWVGERGDDRGLWECCTRTLHTLYTHPHVIRSQAQAHGRKHSVRRTEGAKQEGTADPSPDRPGGREYIVDAGEVGCQCIRVGQGVPQRGAASASAGNAAACGCCSCGGSGSGA